MKRIVLLVLFFIGMQSSFAQQADRIQRGQRGYVPPPKYSKGTYIEIKDPQQEAAIIIPKCEQEFGLDDFQKEIMKSMIIKKIESENAILEDKGNTRDDRKKKIIELNNNYLTELASILTPEQINQYKVMDFTETSEDRKERKRKEKEKKKRKKKNKS